MEHNHWILGGVRSGKTAALVQFAQDWWARNGAVNPPYLSRGQSVLLFAMNGDNRRHVTQQVLTATAGAMPLRSTTPLGFFEDEVMLFWPLILEQHQGAQGLPLRLRPEAEQYLAVQFWGPAALESLNQIERFSTERWARNLLDVIQLAAFGGIALETVDSRLQAHWPDVTVAEDVWQQMREMVLRWRAWCLGQGFLTYGLVTDLYGTTLLPLPDYQSQLQKRYGFILADDVESYPAIARRLFEHCHHGGMAGFYTANPEFSVRLGLGADPDYLLGLEQSLSCHVRSLPDTKVGLGMSLWPKLSARLAGQNVDLQDAGLDCLSTMTRSQLLRRTAERVIELVKTQNVNPSDIVILGPGLDALARYALIEMIEAQGIPVVSLKEQRSLNESALVRSLLTLLMFVYEGMGRCLDQDAVAEMLVVMTAESMGLDHHRHDRFFFPQGSIDPVRAGLLADYCFKPDSQRPELLPLEVFSRWDRIGSQGAIAYRKLRDWIQRQHERVLRSPTSNQTTLADTLSQAIEFFWAKHSLRYDQIAMLRELLETTQHLEAIAARQQTDRLTTLQTLITILQQGTMIANPYPASLQGFNPPGVTLATAYQYRIARLSHPYHFWLDIGSTLWQQGSLISLWGAFSFLQQLDSQQVNLLEQEDCVMKYQIKDLVARTTEKVFLCHSQLSISGHEQMGVLIALVEESA